MDVATDCYKDYIDYFDYQNENDLQVIWREHLIITKSESESSRKTYA
jgi:hypothetical protein